MRTYSLNPQEPLSALAKDLAANLTATLARMGSFLGVNAALFPYEAVCMACRLSWFGV